MPILYESNYFTPHPVIAAYYFPFLKGIFLVLLGNKMVLCRDSVTGIKNNVYSDSGFMNHFETKLHYLTFDFSNTRPLLTGLITQPLAHLS